MKICKYCRKQFYCRKSIDGYIRKSIFNKQIFCSSLCAKKYRSGKNHPFWKGGFGNRNGYLFNNKMKKLWHRFIMEQYLGRKLKKYEIIHHLNGNVIDNNIKNLIITNHSEHTKLHSKNRKRDKIGRFLCLKR
jgi:hypothetical protein